MTRVIASNKETIQARNRRVNKKWIMKADIFRIKITTQATKRK